MNQRNISEFFKDDYTQYASYDVVRKIGSYVDGLKISARKVVHTTMKLHIRELKKVSQLASKVSDETQYLHGEGSLAGVIVGLGQDFVGSNNIPLLVRDGNFGTRFIPMPSASRYIYTKMDLVMERLFCKEDQPVLIHQEFEGDPIEPRFFVPTLPLILINGSRGMAIGFSHDIFPRDPIAIAMHIKAVLQGKQSKYDFVPAYVGFEGEVRRLDGNSYQIRGKMERTNTTTLTVTEIPVGISLTKYKEHLDKLEENRIIRSYQDKSNDDKFKFIIRVPRELTNVKTDEELMRMLKLIKTETENITCNDENLQVREFKSPKELMEAFVAIKLEYMQKRKNHMIKKLSEELKVLMARLTFVKAVVDGKLKLNNRAMAAIEKDLDKMDRVIRVNGSYDFLLSMAISSITKERYAKLREQLKNETARLKELKAATPEQMWIEDIDKLLEVL